MTQTYICEHSHFIAYMKVSKEKLIMPRMIELLLLWIFIIIIKFKIIGVDIANGRQWLTETHGEHSPMIVWRLFIAGRTAISSLIQRLTE